jgi:hypothetical protein
MAAYAKVRQTFLIDLIVKENGRRNLRVLFIFILSKL